MRGLGRSSTRVMPSETSGTYSPGPSMARPPFVTVLSPSFYGCSLPSQYTPDAKLSSKCGLRRASLTAFGLELVELLQPLFPLLACGLPFRLDFLDAPGDVSAGLLPVPDCLHALPERIVGGHLRQGDDCYPDS